LKPSNKPKRNRLIALSFVSLLLIVMYGPMAQWFVAADRVLFDQLASRLPNKPLANTMIVSIDSTNLNAKQTLDRYGEILAVLKQSKVARIVLAQPPDIAPDASLPGWAAALGSGTPVYAPTRHRFGDLATRNGFIELQPDSDGVLRRAAL